MARYLIYPETKEMVGGFTIVDVPTRAVAIWWAAKIAVACRCAQEVREFVPDPSADEQIVRRATKETMRCPGT